MRRRHREPEFAAAHAKRSSDRLKALWADPEYRARQIAMLRARNAARKTVGQAVDAPVEVPAWAERAGLAAAYRAVAASKGEEAAAKHCRAITAARRSGALA